MEQTIGHGLSHTPIDLGKQQSGLGRPEQSKLEASSSLREAFAEAQKDVNGLWAPTWKEDVGREEAANKAHLQLSSHSG